MSNIIIRGLEQDDWQQIALISSLPQSQRQTLRLPYQSLDFYRRRVERQVEQGRTVVAIADENLVGVASLSVGSGRCAHAAGLGINVHDDYHGRGIGSALMVALLNLADNWLNLTRLELDVYCDNDRAIALYKKFGFEIEGTKRKFAFRDGEFVDAYGMARIR
ncbi:GNAT family N-acetyltransferase [Phormidium tenue FACHB-886]|nr:GNAT family N-acetyltransferase [Phormidium tenue FACHB-886]